jgi:hypothetical protein
MLNLSAEECSENELLRIQDFEALKPYSPMRYFNTLLRAWKGLALVGALC